MWGQLQSIAVYISVFATVFMTACSNTPLYDIDETMTEASERAGSSDPADRSIYAGRPASSGMSVAVESTVWMDDDDYEDDHYSPVYNIAKSVISKHRYLIGRHSSVNLGVSPYVRNTGYSLAYSARFDRSQVTGQVFFADADFKRNEVANFERPWLIGFNLDFQALFPLGSMYMESGLRLEWGELGYQYLQPLTISGIEYSADALGYFGIGVPSGVQMDLGAFTAEVTATPMLLFHYSNTRLGWNNDLATITLQVPVELQFGFMF